MLNHVEYKFEYDTSNNNIIEEFYKPCLSNSLIYKRGVGYFTSGWLSENSKGLAQFIENGGKVQYITSPILDKNDLEALQGNFDKSRIDSIIINNINNLENSLADDTRNLLGWLVHDNIIEFKFAIPRINLEGGDFHDKFGIFIDKENNLVSFNGSMNESIKGFYNYESITVCTSWQDKTGFEICKGKLKRFDNLWDNKDPNIFVYEINELIKRKLIQLKSYNSKRPYKLTDEKIDTNKVVSKPYLPSYLKLHNYQKTAYTNWQNNDYKGILSMATGSGKTITAFSSIVQLLNIKPRLAVLVVVPYQHLLVQWAEGAKDFNIDFIECFESSAKWTPLLSSALTEFKLETRNQLFFITTNSTYLTSKFQNLVKEIDDLLLIVDEAHNFGSKAIRNNYLENANYRLGLSATPERHLDEDGTNAIKGYLGDIIFEYSLKDAINDKKLTPYYYFPVLVYLTAQEEEEFIELSKKISRIAQFNNDDNSALEMLLIKRARIIGGAHNKLPTLDKLITDNNLSTSQDNLFYCASTKDEGGEIRMVDQVYTLLSKKGMIVEKFTALDSSSKGQRKNLINNLADNTIDGLVAIKCLDEGVDIPSVKRAFILSSSSNPKEFIQRRGRVLRRFDGKDFAEIYDFMVVPMHNSSEENYKYNRKYLETELTRYREFARLAINYPSCEEPLLDVAEKYNLLHI
ncbi:MAG: hypothetical protein DRG78_00615 [Epsilonproteobacteria bacterium]|nr:MAG: hypothetical protein DRG78_00615 [Campylobacterota bacterium]